MRLHSPRSLFIVFSPSVNRNPADLPAFRLLFPKYKIVANFHRNGKNSGVLHRHSPLRQWFDSPCCWQQSMQWDSSTLQAVKWESRLLCGSFASRPQHCQERRDEGSGEEGDFTHRSCASWLPAPYHMHLTSFNFCRDFYLLGFKNYNLKACFMRPMWHLTLETDVGHGVEQTRFLC